MPPLKFLTKVNTTIIAVCCTQLVSVYAQAVEFEITPIIAQTFSPDLASANTAESLSTTNEPNFGLAFSWQDTPTGQGQILVNYIARDFTDNVSQSSHSFDTVYTHFNGVAMFQERNYTTTVGLGIGATYFNSDFDNAIYPSMTAAIGTRYEFSGNLALITELRAYATLTEEDDTLFCQNESCVAHFDSALWFDTQISIGLAYRF